MPSKLVIEVYQFDELAPEVQEEVIEKNRDINVDFDDWAEFDLEDAKTQLEAQGYREPEIAYSGFSNQGDGASFTAKIDLVKWLKAHKLCNQYRALYRYAADGNWISFDVYRTMRQYCHENTVDVRHDLDYGASDKADEQAYEIEGRILADVRTWSRKIYKDLESSYDALTGEESIKDTILGNEYKFTKTGRMVNESEGELISE